MERQRTRERRKKEIGTIEAVSELEAECAKWWPSLWLFATGHLDELKNGVLVQGAVWISLFTLTRGAGLLLKSGCHDGNRGLAGVGLAWALRPSNTSNTARPVEC